MKMKAVLLFLVFFLAGIAVILSYQYLLPSQFHFPMLKPAITTKFSLANAPSNSIRGTIASMSGTINWLSRTADKPVTITSKRTIQQGEDLSTGQNGKAAVNIHNTALVSLSPNTHVSFIELLPQNFVINQVKGSVIYETTIQVPVSIVTNDLLTVANNGIFSITYNPDSSTVSVYVGRGVATEGYEDSQNNSNVVPLSEGQTYIFNTTTRQGSVQ